MRLVLVLLLLATAACSHEMAACKGQMTQLNVGRWDPTPGDLR